MSLFLSSNISKLGMKPSGVQLIRRYSTSDSSTSTPSEIQVDSSLLFQFSHHQIDHQNTSNTKELYKLGEFINCRMIECPFNPNSKTPPNVSNRLIRLKHDGVLKTKRFEIFHEHICGLRSFTFKNLRFDFKRPSLYEYISLKV